MTSQTPKPEWFQMAEADGFKPEVKSKKALKILALTAPLAVLAAGIVFAQNQPGPIATASAATPAASSPAASSASDPITVTTPSAQAATVPASQSSTSPAPATPAAATAGAINVSQVSTPVKASITIKRPPLTLPTNGADGDGDGDDARGQNGDD